MSVELGAWTYSHVKLSCRAQYSQMSTKSRSKNQDRIEEQAEFCLFEAHRFAFSKVCRVISLDVIYKKVVPGASG